MGIDSRVEPRYELVLKDGSQEKREERIFMSEVRPGSHLYVDGTDWVVVQVNERVGLAPEAIARPANERR